MLCKRFFNRGNINYYPTNKMRLYVKNGKNNSKSKKNDKKCIFFNFYFG